MAGGGQASPTTKPKHIFIYEWDLYEPFFTRNWTFTYHLPPKWFKNQMKKISKEGRALSKWEPTLTKIPELSQHETSPTKPKRRRVMPG